MPVSNTWISITEADWKGRGQSADANVECETQLKDKSYIYIRRGLCGFRISRRLSVHYGLLYHDTVQSGRQLPMFRRSLVPPSCRTPPKRTNPKVMMLTASNVMMTAYSLKQDSLLSCSCTELRLSLKLNSVTVDRKRTIPTERPPLVGEVSANLCG
jgi:hypothetical protein